MGLLHTPLKRACLPISPPRQILHYFSSLSSGFSTFVSAADSFSLSSFLSAPDSASSPDFASSESFDSPSDFSSLSSAFLDSVSESFLSSDSLSPSVAAALESSPSFFSLLAGVAVSVPELESKDRRRSGDRRKRQKQCRQHKYAGSSDCNL